LESFEKIKENLVHLIETCKHSLTKRKMPSQERGEPSTIGMADLEPVFPLSCARVRAHTAFRDCAHA